MSTSVAWMCMPLPAVYTSHTEIARAQVKESLKLQADCLLSALIVVYAEQSLLLVMLDRVTAS